MLFEDLRSAIWARFATEWGSNSTIEYEGVPFTVPATGYAKISIIEGNGSQITFGTAAKTYRYLNMIQIDLFEPQGQSPTKINQLVDLAIPIFLGQTFSGIVCTGVDTAKGSSRHWDIRTLRFSIQHDTT